ncbi:fungal-specific transcription factor domain-containing protein [Limtongia smithiae]|uniref:fungal-specific transcription factor domain-containing protein n=1 Tax=Limtongia smithiae TaxID=1125753 RepID=UPI0034CF6C80
MLNKNLTAGQCNGQKKCVRCTKLNLECLYRTGDEIYSSRSSRPATSASVSSNGMPSAYQSDAIWNDAGSKASPSTSPISQPPPGLHMTEPSRPMDSAVMPILNTQPDFGEQRPQYRLPIPTASTPRSSHSDDMAPEMVMSPHKNNVVDHIIHSNKSTPSEMSVGGGYGAGSLSTLSPADSEGMNSGNWHQHSGRPPVTSAGNSSSKSRSALAKSERTWAKEKVKSFAGLTSSLFPFEQEPKILSDNNAKASDEDELSEQEDEDEDDFSDTSLVRAGDPNYRKKRKFLGLEFEEGRRLIQVYESEINSMYPIFEVHELNAKYEEFWGLYETYGYCPADEKDVSVIKLVLAIATGVIENHVDIGRKLYLQVLRMTERRIVAGTADVYTLVSLWLIHNYQFHSDLESLAYRTICYAAVLTFELGLHQSSKIEIRFPQPKQRERCRALFWCVYVVDRRLAFSTGRPFTLRDEDVDQELPKLAGVDTVASEDTRIRSLYLHAMIEYSRLLGRVYRTVTAVKPPQQISNDDIDYTEFLIHKWYNSLPQDLRLHRASEIGYTQLPRLSRKLQTILYLRSKLMLLHVYRPVFFSTSTIAAKMPYAIHAVEIALCMIRELSRLQFETDLYRSCQLHYNYFLISALGVLFMAIIHAPAVFAAPCKREFNMALDLIKLFSKVSSVGRRLWATVKKLRTVTSAYLQSKPTEDRMPHRESLDSAALTTAQGPSNDDTVYFGDEGSSKGHAKQLPVGTEPTEAMPQSVQADSVLTTTTIEPTSHGNGRRSTKRRGSVGRESRGGRHKAKSDGLFLDAADLYTEVSELFNLMTGELHDTIDETFNAPDDPHSLSGSRNASTSGPVHPSQPQQQQQQQQPQWTPLDMEPTFTDNLSQQMAQQLLGEHNPLGIEAAQMAQILANGAGNNEYDDELFKAIENLF